MPVRSVRLRSTPLRFAEARLAYLKSVPAKLIFLVNKIGISRNALELGIKRSHFENAPLPVVMWSYGLLTLTQLNKILLWQQDN